MSETDTSRAPHAGEAQAASLKELALLFFRLGTTAFGGPAAHIALMEDEVVRRRGWLTHEQFLDLLGATNLIPGPNSTEMALHIGHQRAGWRGLLVAGVCFILPAALITLGLAWIYGQFGALPQTEGFLYGVKPVIIAVVVQALWGLARVAVKTTRLAIVTLAAVVVSFSGVNELAILLSAGVALAVARWITAQSPTACRHAVVAGLSPSIAAAPVAVTVGGATAASFSLAALFLFFLTVGAVLFGSGYVLLVFLRADLVDRWHWLTEAQLLDAVAVGQVTPGPVFTTATFVGYLLGGPRGAVVATVGIFLPAFIFVALSGPLVPRLRRSPTAAAFLDGVNVASLALMVAVTWHLGRTAVVDVPSAMLAVTSAFLLICLHVNSAWLVLSGGLVGLGITN